MNTNCIKASLNMKEKRKDYCLKKKKKCLYKNVKINTISHSI